MRLVGFGSCKESERVSRTAIVRLQSGPSCGQSAELASSKYHPSLLTLAGLSNATVGLVGGFGGDGAIGTREEFAGTPGNLLQTERKRFKLHVTGQIDIVKMAEVAS